jgi:hypothetical protein
VRQAELPSGSGQAFAVLLVAVAVFLAAENGIAAL